MSDRDALHVLSCEYAAAADRRDVNRFLTVFEPDAVLVIPGTPTRTIRGWDELAEIPRRLGRYARTFHLLGQATYQQPDADTATGEVYCSAHHLTVEDGNAHDRILLIRYLDQYRRGASGWRIARRTVAVQWSEERPAIPPSLLEATPPEET